MNTAMVHGDRTRDRLRTLVLAGWSLTALAARLGYAASSVGRYAHGTRWVPQAVADDVEHLSRRLDGEQGPTVRAVTFAYEKGWHQTAEVGVPVTAREQLTWLDAQVSRCPDCWEWVLPPHLMRVAHVHRPSTSTIGAAA